MISGGSVAAYLGGNQKPPYPRYLEEELNNTLGQPQRQALDGAGCRRRRVEGAAVVHRVCDVCHRGRCPHQPQRLQRALLLPAEDGPAPRRPGGQLPGSQSVRRRREFRRRRDRLGDGTPRRRDVDQPDPRQIARRLPAHPRHRGGRQGQGQLQVQQADDDPQPLRLAEGHPGQSATPVRRPARPLPEILSRDGGGGARQRREVGLFHAAHPGLGQDADRRRNGASSATWPTASSIAAWSPA